MPSKSKSFKKVSKAHNLFIKLLEMILIQKKDLFNTSRGKKTENVMTFNCVSVLSKILAFSPL